MKDWFVKKVSSTEDLISLAKACIDERKYSQLQALLKKNFRILLHNGDYIQKELISYARKVDAPFDLENNCEVK